MRGSYVFLAVFTVGTLSAIASACGGAGESVFDPGQGDSGDGLLDSTSPGFTDSTTPGNGCVPTTCAALGVGCGMQSDGCGAVIDCGGCTAPATCGGGGTPSACGGTAGCKAKTCVDLAVGCGKQSDGCGGIVDCGGCTAPAFCGGGGPSTCGGGMTIIPDGGACVPKGCPATATCGPVADGCGGLTVSCGTCTAPQFCGGGSAPSTCGVGALPDGGAICTPNTCAAFPAGTCGAQADGCGGLTANCLPGGCPSGQICGLNTPSRCGSFDAAPPCTGLCLSQANCDAASPTTLKGTVFAPDGVEPMYGALVYVANCALAPFAPNVSCDQCGAAASGCPLVSATTGFDGKFTLTNVPAATSYPLVIQLGRWRREVTVAAQPACTTVDLSTTVAGRKQTHLPTMSAVSAGAGGACATAFAAATDKTDIGDIPLTAIATGNVDPLECVLRKIGINDCEFTDPVAAGANPGRIRFYKANGATVSGATPSWTTLAGNLTELKKYDVVLLPCEGFPDPLVTPVDAGAATANTSPWQQNMVDYTSAGGRVYATHYSYTWLTNIAKGTTGAAGPTPFSSTAVWNVNQPNESPVTGDIDTTLPDGGVFVKGSAFASWLGQPSVNALSNVSPPKIDLSVSRHDMSNVNNPPAQRWISVDPTLPGGGGSAAYPGVPQHMTFNTPVPPADGGVVNQCGRVLFSDFHVNTGNGAGKTFPAECGGALTPQEKVLEFMLFDLASCVVPVVPPPPPVCMPKSCAATGVSCGPSGDGCGNVIAGGCGTCVTGTCGGGGTPGVCGSVACTPKGCGTATCGFVPDGCGGSVNCGTCATGTCGGGGTPGVCGSGTCAPRTCTLPAPATQCGPLGDNCGNLLDCGPCPTGFSCFSNKCVPPSCTPRTCSAAMANCGPVADGCGNLLDCGPCVAPATCGGGGISNQCGGGIR
jgi:hypothetical protein